jgi:hypothetical protein
MEPRAEGFLQQPNPDLEVLKLQSKFFRLEIWDKTD